MEKEDKTTREQDRDDYRAARGIGRAFAEAYVRKGARVALCDVDVDRVEQSFGSSTFSVGGRD